MSVLLVRLDDRLIHGQVSIGWAGHLKPTRILVLDDEAAADQWEGDLVCAACPESIRPEVMTVADGAAALVAGRFDADRVLILLRGTAAARRLVESGFDPGRLNIGGLHHHPGSRAILPFVYLDAAEMADLRALRDRGVALVAQDLPGNKAVDLGPLLAEPPA